MACIYGYSISVFVCVVGVGEPVFLKTKGKYKQCILKVK